MKQHQDTARVGRRFDAHKDAQKSERLERIATAAMAAIIAKHPAQTLPAHEVRDGCEATAAGAVSYARALIAELDAAK